MTKPAVIRKPRFTRYFSIGEDHTATLATKKGFVTLTKTTLLKVVSPNPRETMMELLGDKWDGEYEQLPDMEYFPGGVFDVHKGKKVSW